MAQTPIDIKIGLGVDYDPSGAQTAEQDLNKLNEAAAGGGGGGDGGAAAEQAAASTRELAAAQEEEAAAADKAAASNQALGAAAGEAAAAMQGEAAAVQGVTAALQGQTTAAQAAAAAITEGNTVLQEGVDLLTQQSDTLTQATTAVQEQTAALQEQTTATQEQATATEQATQTATEADEALRAAMELEAKSAKELEDEMKRLIEARKAAAAAGDVETYVKLKSRYDECKKALQQFNGEAKLGHIAMLQKAQTGMGLANTLGSLAEKVQNGTVTFGDMAGAITAVTMAIKAGMGPIGWIMMAIQGLSMAWDWYSNKQKEAEEAEKKRVEELMEAERKHAEALDKLAEAQRGLLLDGWKKEMDEFEKRQKEVSQKAEMERRRAEQAASQDDQRKKDAARAAYEQEKARLDVLKASGSITAQEAENRRRAAEDALNAELQGIERAAIVRRNQAEVQAAHAAEKQAEELEAKLKETYGKFDDVLSVKMPSPEEWKALQLKLDAHEASAQEQQMSSRIKREATKIQEALAEMGVTIGGGPEEIIAFLDQMRKAKQEGEQKAQALRDSAEAHRTEAKATKEQLATADAANQAQKDTLAATRAVADARAAQAQKQEEWSEVSRRSLDEQEAWLRTQLSQVQEGSDLWKKYNSQLRQVNASQISKELSQLGETYKVTGNYALKDSRTQAQIYRDDEKALHERRAALLRMIAAAGDDARLQEQLGKQLKETDKQIAGLKQTMHQGAKAARKWLKELEPPKLKAKNKMVQRNLDNLSKGYKKAAARAAKAAEKGDAKALDRAKRSMDTYAKSMKRLAAKPGAAEKLHKDALNHLDLARRGAADSGKAAKKNAAAAKKTADSQAAAAKDEKRNAAAAKKKAAANEQAAAAAKKSIPKAQSTEAKIAGLNAQVKDLQKEMQKLAEETAKLSASIASLGTHAAQAAAATATAANAAAAADKKLAKQIESCMKAINRLKR